MGVRVGVSVSVSVSVLVHTACDAVCPPPPVRAGAPRPLGGRGPAPDGRDGKRRHRLRGVRRDPRGQEPGGGHRRDPHAALGARGVLLPVAARAGGRHDHFGNRARRGHGRAGGAALPGLARHCGAGRRAGLVLWDAGAPGRRGGPRADQVCLALPGLVSVDAGARRARRARRALPPRAQPPAPTRARSARRR